MQCFRITTHFCLLPNTLFLQATEQNKIWTRSPYLKRILSCFNCLYMKNLFISLWFYLLSRFFSSVTQSCLNLCNPMDFSRPGLPVHHQLLELAQTHVHRVGDAVQPSHPLLFPVVCIISQSLSRAGLGFWTSNRYHLNFFYTLSHGSLNCIPKFTFK